VVNAALLHRERNTNTPLKINVGRRSVESHDDSYERLGEGPKRGTGNEFRGRGMVPLPNMEPQNSSQSPLRADFSSEFRGPRRAMATPSRVAARSRRTLR